MKWLLLFFALFNILNINAYEYKPLLTEGKSWKVLVKHWPDEDYYCMYKVSGDTLVDGIKCKKILCYNIDEGEESAEIICAYEENQKLCGFNDYGKPDVLLDFNYKKDDIIVEDIEDLKVLDEEYLMIKGVQRRCLKLSVKDRGENVYWIEGIGTTSRFWLGYFCVMIGEFRYLVECYENGKTIFSMDEFRKTTNIKAPTLETDKQERIYGYDGIRISNNNQPKIVIKGNKKVLMHK